MRYTIQQIGQSLTGADEYNNTRTTVILQEYQGEVDIVHKPGNPPQASSVIEGTIKPDQRTGRPRFFKDRQPAPQQQRQYQPQQQSQAPQNVNKADPAKSDSIENQSYYKQVVELARIHVELNAEKYAGMSLRDLNDKIIAEARWAKNQMRNPDAAQQLMEGKVMSVMSDAPQPTYSYQPEQVPITAYNDPPVEPKTDDQGLY